MSDILNILEKTRQQLLDLSRRNTLLNYKEKSRTVSVDELPQNIFKILVQESKSLQFSPKVGQHIDVKLSSGAISLIDKHGEIPLESAMTMKKNRHSEISSLKTPHDNEDLMRRCKKLAQESRIAIEETGSNLLFLAICFLEWYAEDNSHIPIKAPLILIPVVLERKYSAYSTSYTYSLSYTGDDIETNMSLAEKLFHDFNLIFPELSEKSSLEEYLDQVVELSKNKPRWRVLSEIRLDLFSFAKLLMYRDLDDSQWNNQKLSENTNLQEILLGNQEDKIVEESIYEEEVNIDKNEFVDKTPLILDADSSQHTVIVESLWKNKNLVVEGPPGTGKSQTIANLIAVALSQKKSVLFVAEKKAALDVVKSRLNHVGLGDFCLELHNHKMQKGELLKDIKKRLDLDENYFNINELESDIKKLKLHRDKLSAYSNLVNQVAGLKGEKIYEIFWAIERLRSELGQVLRIDIEKVEEWTGEIFDENLQKLENCGMQYLELPDNMLEHWQGFEPTNILPNDEENIEELLAKLLLNTENYKEFLDNLTQKQIPILHTQKYLNTLLHCDSRLLADIPLKFQEEMARQFFNDISAPSNNLSTKLKTWLKRTILSIVNSTARWVVRVREKMPYHLLKWLLENPLNHTVICQELLKNNQIYFSQLSEFKEKMSTFGQFHWQQWINAEGDFLAQLTVKIHFCQKSVYALGQYATFCRFKQEANNQGLSTFTEAIMTHKIKAEQAAKQLEYCVYQTIARKLMQKYAPLATFTRTSHEKLRQDFVNLDKKLLQATRQRMIFDIAQREIPQGNASGNVTTFTELKLIKHELSKKMRHIPIRQLVRRATRALQAIKPCFMMSPLSVAHYLPPNNVTFDLLIIDEASQVRPQDALGAIARSRKIMIVGDSKQLPPTNFFERLNDEDGDDDEEDTIMSGQESILDLCSSVYQKRRLRWHYRSEHESLIAFSNHHFYDDDLIVFPAAKTSQEFGVHSHYVENAYYSKGKNIKEAQAVVEAVIAHFQKNSALSLGVATFNSKQQALIDELLDKRLQQETDLEKKIKASEETAEPFFIKNLENVQGDERDVIFVSTTYGRDRETGRVYQRFGPIASDTGWRRLNVIFTRARKRLDLFTSLHSSDIHLTATSKRGTKTLKEYLEYAKTGKLLDYGQATGRAADSDFEVAVAKILNENGYKTEPQVGVAGFRIDIGVCHPQNGREYILGIECDGATYHSAKSVRDRDRLRQEILESKGWTIHRIWSTDWFKNRESEIQRLLNVIKELKIKPMD